jgi:hypothetical protein
LRNISRAAGGGIRSASRPRGTRATRVWSRLPDRLNESSDSAAPCVPGTRARQLHTAGRGVCALYVMGKTLSAAAVAG